MYGAELPGNLLGLLGLQTANKMPVYIQTGQLFLLGKGLLHIGFPKTAVPGIIQNLNIRSGVKLETAMTVTSSGFRPALRQA